MAQNANTKNASSADLLKWRDIDFAPMTASQFDNETRALQDDYTKAIINSDAALYGLLRHLYHTYLLAQTDNTMQAHVNRQVSAAIKVEKYDVRKQPEKNCFSKLIMAYVADPNKDSNAVRYHFPQRSNTYAMAMHWALRQKWSPDKFFNGMNGRGIRALRDDEIKARQDRSEGNDVADMSVDAALEIINQENLIGGTEIDVNLDSGLNTGVNLVLAYVREDENGQKVTMLRQVAAPKADVDNWLKLAAKEQTIDNSDVKQLLRTVAAGEIFFDRAPADSERVTIKTTEAETFVCYSLSAARSEKQVRFIVSRSQGVPEGLPENELLGLPPDRVKDLADKISGVGAITNWRFERSEEKDTGTMYSMLADAAVENDDKSVAQECKQWHLLPNASVKVNKDIDEFLKALDCDGPSFSARAWLEACDGLKDTTEKEPPKGKKEPTLQWVQLRVGDTGLVLESQSAGKGKGTIEKVERGDGPTIETAFTSGNLPNQVKKFLEQLRVRSFVIAAIGPHIVMRGAAQGVEYAVGFTRRKFVEKPTAASKPKKKISA